MNFRMALQRARRALRDDLKLYLVAVSSLTVAFLCLVAALLAITNLSSLASRLSDTRRMTVYLADGADSDSIEELRLLIGGLSDVASVEYLSSDAARTQFLEDSDLAADLGDLEADVFPSSLEVSFAAGVPEEKVTEVATRVERLRAVDDVETYAGWFADLDGVINTGRGLAGGLALLVVICVLAVVGNTIRLSVAQRRDEIEVMKLCGATDHFVRAPFLVEGVFQGLFASVLAIAMIFVAFVLLRDELDSSLFALAGTRAEFLSAWVVLGVVAGGAASGVLGSAISLRRYLNA